VSFCFQALARLFDFLFFTHKFIDFKGVREGFAVPLKNPFQLKQKSNVPFVGRTKSMTEKITEGSA